MVARLTMWILGDLSAWLPPPVSFFCVPLRMARYADCSTETITAEDIARVVQPASGRPNTWTTFTHRGVTLRAPAPAVVATMAATRETQETSIRDMRAGKLSVKVYNTRRSGRSPAAASTLAAVADADAATATSADDPPAATNPAAAVAGVVHIKVAARESEAVAAAAAAGKSPAGSPTKKRRNKKAVPALAEEGGRPGLPGDLILGAEPPSPLAASLIRAVPGEIGRFRLDSADSDL